MGHILIDLGLYIVNLHIRLSECQIPEKGIMFADVSLNQQDGSWMREPAGSF